ncbi:MAG: Crp/Fnr family transcriptional regulator [Gammaproteobacteria bacterium]|nr:Crp/Fnr family transcriptional regulator [Gammaproteobacteria bacterium]MCF6231133.1 Crp/Fnr family transcriptional regulator [Gammaproteobacteria bacterium]
MFKTLQKNALFSSLPERELQSLVDEAYCLKLSQDEILFIQGDPAEHFYWLASGMLRLYRMAPNGDEKVIEIIQPGQTFAEAIMFMGQPQPRFPVAAQMIAEGEVWRFNNQQFLGYLGQSVESCFRMMANMSHRLHQHVKEIDRLTLQTASERVVNYLLQALAKQSDNNHNLKLNISKQMLAAQLSIKPETLSRTLGRLSREGLIDSQGSTIKVIDTTALRQLVEI